MTQTKSAAIRELHAARPHLSPSELAAEIGLARLPIGSNGARRISEALGEPDPRKPHKFSEEP